MRPYRKPLHIALAIAGAALVLPSRYLDAQGGAKTARPAAPAPVETADQLLPPARSVVQQLVGRWRFAIWFAGNFDGPPDASGTRVVAALYDDLRLQWTEQLDSSTTQSQGVIGFDPRSGRFFSSAIYSEGKGVELLSGTLSVHEPLITFAPVNPASAERRLMESFTLTLIDRDHFTWAPLDRGWRAVFTRER